MNTISCPVYKNTVYTSYQERRFGVRLASVGSVSGGSGNEGELLL